MKKDKKENKPIINLDINSLLSKTDDLSEFNPILVLTLILNKLIDNFESKDIIPKNMGKAYALISNTNQVQKDLINEIISKQNDNKGQIKKMYFDIIKETLKSVRNNPNEIEKNNILNRILKR